MKSRRRAAILLATAAAALAAGPALAQVIAAPAGDAGFWATVNGWVAPAAATWIAGAATWAAARFHARTGVAISADLTREVRETATTGLFLAAHEMEVEIDRALPKAKRQELVEKGVAWVLKRLPGPLGRLGFAEPVVEAIVVKMLGQIIGGAPADPVAIVSNTVAPLGFDPSGLLGRTEAAAAGLAAGVLPEPKA